MADFEVDARPYFQILHALLSNSAEERGGDYTKAVMQWMWDHQPRLNRVTTRAEYRVLEHVFTYWMNHQVAPSREALEMRIRTAPQPKILLDLLEEFDKHEPDLKELAVDDLNAQLDIRVAEFEKFRLHRFLAHADEITLNQLQLQDKNKTMLEGPRDAINYLVGKFQEGILIDDKPAPGGVLAEQSIEQLHTAYKKAKELRIRKSLFIRTGITAIDETHGGLRRGELVSVLGFVANRKTGLIRTIGYHAATAGFRVLHIPLESSVKEEHDAYTVMHVKEMKFPPRINITKGRLDKVQLTPEEEELYFGPVLEDFNKHIGQNVIVRTPGGSRSWTDVKSIIERENYRAPIDLVIVDYLSMLSTPGSRDEIADKTAIIQDAKQLAMNINNGRGLCFMTPVQGSRNGYAEAANNGGRWETSGIFKYSELDKSIDTCYYVYLDESLASQNRIKFGSCKTRREADIPTCYLGLDHNSGMMVNVDQADIEATTAPPQGKDQRKDQKKGKDVEQGKESCWMPDFTDSVFQE